MNRTPPKRCPSCPPGARSCRCALREAEADRAAEAWARERGVRVEREDARLGLCGDRFPSAEQRKSLAERILDATVLRDYRELVRLRREEIASTRVKLAEEDARLAEQERFLDLMFDGEGLNKKEIAQEYGRQSHSFASDRLQEIREEILAAVDRGFVALPCKRQKCRRAIEKVNLKRGRKHEYCSEDCALADASERYRRKKRAGAAAKNHDENHDAQALEEGARHAWSF